MKLKVSDDDPESSSRVGAIRLSLFTLRFLENWRAYVDDLDKVIILHAVAAISLERLTRTDLHDGLQDIHQPFPTELIGKCNISSIAEATGFSRETTRRKVEELMEDQTLVRLENGGIYFRPGAMQEEGTLGLLHKQFELVAQLSSDLIRDGVLAPTAL